MQSEQNLKLAAHDRFAVARAAAINDFATLEYHLGLLFSDLSGMEVSNAFAIFAAIQSTRDKAGATARLLTLAHGDRYKVFFQDWTSKLNGVNNTRNKVVHWIQVGSTTGGQEFRADRDVFLLQHPDPFPGGKLYLHEVVQFRKITYFHAQLVFAFRFHLKLQPSGEHPVAPGKTPWEEVFGQAITMPPYPAHPLAEHYANHATE
jgi:hypothetical protein